MKKFPYSTLLQAAFWISIWSLFAFRSDHAEQTAANYWLATLRVTGFALLFNAAYYGLVPLYF
ncbi:MAG: hypothetical protein KDC54_20455, partial [Lewinella sp.]|nr:hypothetical protein [Lewinella sp.]